MGVKSSRGIPCFSPQARSAVFCLCLVLCALAAPARGQQINDPDADVSVSHPAFGRDKGPSVRIDQAHHNFHTVDGRYKPFADLLRNDGFRVSASTTPFTPASLKNLDLLVIANALNAVNDNNWTLPTPSAFTAEEIAAVKAWIGKGGALLLVADHMPFAGAATDLAGAFGFTFINGFAFHTPTVWVSDPFTKADQTLLDDPITRGRVKDEAVTTVTTFTGSAFIAPREARPLLTFKKDYVVLMPTTAWEFTGLTPRREAAGMLQGAVLTQGKGRISVFGEAGMFTAQVVTGDTPAKFGFNSSSASENKQFILNLVHWLTGSLRP